jgi:dTDP-4-amino-4,6-dideoxygalactose transaminase
MPVQTVQKIHIPFNKPFVDNRVLEYIKSVIESGKIGGDGPMCKSVEAQLRELFTPKHVLLTTSCTHALEMAMMMLDLKPGDEVITPSFTFVSTANAIIRGGGKPVFCEINERSATIDVKDFERRITKRTKAVIPVHYAGVSAEMDEVLEVASAHRLVVVEDAAQGVNAKYKGKFLGTIGDAAAYSFHDTKNYVSGEGGAFLTNNKTYARLAEIIREKGTNRSNFLRGEVDKYTWVDHGSSYILSDILAAVLKYQLDERDRIQTNRKRIHERYMAGLQDLAHREKLKLMFIPQYCESNYHIFYILLHDEAQRIAVMNKLKEFGIGTTFHYVPLHSSPYAVKALGTVGQQLPITDRIYSTLLRLPIYPQLENADIDYVVERLREILK